MSLIKKIIPSSRNGDLSALLTLIIGAFAKNDWSTDTYLTSIIEVVNGYNSSLIEALNRLKVYSIMADKDYVRDMAIRSLFKLVDGYTYIPFAEIKEAALVVENVLQQYGLNIQNTDYSEESADIESLLNDLNKPEVLAAIAKMQGVAEIISKLRTAQSDFETVALQQAEGESAKKDLVTASKLKKEVIKEINDNMVGYLNTMAKVNPDTYKASALTIAELIDNNNELVKRRRTANEADAEAV